MSTELAILTPAPIDRAAQIRALEQIGGLTVTAADGANISAGLPGGSEVIDAQSRRTLPHCVTLYSDPRPAAPSAWDLAAHGIAADAALVETTVQIEAGTDDELGRIVRAAAHLAAEHRGVLIDPEEGLLLHADGSEEPLQRLVEAGAGEVQDGEEPQDDGSGQGAAEDGGGGAPTTTIVDFSWYGLLEDSGGEPPTTKVRRIVREIVGPRGLEVGASVTAHRFWHARCTMLAVDAAADPGRARRLLAEVADATGAFAAEAQPISGITIEDDRPWYGREAMAQSLSTLRQQGGWHGLNPRPLWLLWLGAPYARVRIKGSPAHVEQTRCGRLVQSTAQPQEALCAKKPMRRHLSRWLFALVLPHDPNVSPPPLLPAWSLPEALESR